VVAVDLQPKMIQVLKRRAAKAGVLDRIDARVTSAETMGLDDLAAKVDFTLAFAMVHEFPEAILRGGGARVQAGGAVVACRAQRPCKG